MLRPATTFDDENGQTHRSKQVLASLVDFEALPTKHGRVAANVAALPVQVLLPGINLESWPASEARAA
jgi:hypothetical protein